MAEGGPFWQAFARTMFWRGFRAGFLYGFLAGVVFAVAVVLLL